MQNYIYEFVKNSKKKPVGVVLASVSPTRNNTVYLGWSRCNIKKEPFDKQRGLAIALGRATKEGGVDCVPQSMFLELDNMRVRATKYFKDKTVFA